MKLITVVVLILPVYIQAQVLGCTDKNALNYNPKATQNDGNCSYKKSKLERELSIELSDKVRETSGLIHWNNKLWTHNDDTDANLYALDTLSGKVIETYSLSNTVNTDWEEIAQDDNFMYVGDFGNNGQGNRTDLNILKIEKSSLLTRNPKIDYIRFKYPNQTNFEKEKANTTNFDCEAFLVTNDSICLFTKEWTSKKTTLYTLPKVPGDYIAQQKETFDVQGLITGVNYLPEKQRLVFCGYTKNGNPFIYLFYDFKGHHFFLGNKRRIDLKPKFQQIEGISSRDGVHYYLTSEHLKFLTIDNLQKMQILDLGRFFKTD